MFARKGVFSSIGRAGAAATVVAMALTAVQPSTAFAGSAPSTRGVTASTGTSDATDFSAHRRRYHGGGAAAAAAFAGIVGTGLAIAAAQSRRDYYDSYGYYGAQVYDYYGGPAYYDGPVYYGYRGGAYRANRYPGGYNNPNAYYGGW